jgi:predicted nucleic-acid-binding Zn-ribbon protein
VKTTKQCPKCDGTKIGHLATVHDRDYYYSNVLKERAVGYQPGPSGWLKSGKVEGAGGFEAYVCGECGYYETYVKSPESIPFEDLDGFRWLN